MWRFTAVISPLRRLLSELLLDSLFVLHHEVVWDLCSFFQVIRVFLSESSLFLSYFHGFETRVDLMLVMERHSLLSGDATQAAPVAAPTIVLCILLGHLHVVCEWLS